MNESLMRAFIQAGLSGHGIPVIVANYGKEAFQFDTGQMVVTMRFPRMRLAASSREARAGFTENGLLIYDTIKGYPAMTQEAIYELTGLSKGFVIKTITKFKQSGILGREGSRKSGRWVIRDNLSHCQT